PLGIGGELPAGRSERQMLADRRQHVLQLSPVGMVIEDVIGGDERRPASLGDLGEPGEPPTIARAIAYRRHQPDGIGECLAERAEDAVEPLIQTRRRDDTHDEAVPAYAE